MVSVGWLSLHYYGYVQVHGKDINSIWQTHATVDLCVSVFSTDMHSSSLGARPGGFLSALHKHHNLNNLGIRQEIWQHLFGKIDFVF